MSFDTLANVTLMQGTERRDFNTLVLGPVNMLFHKTDV